MDDYSEPEIRRVPLHSLVLQLVQLGLADVRLGIFFRSFRALAVCSAGFIFHLKGIQEYDLMSKVRMGTGSFRFSKNRIWIVWSTPFALSSVRAL